MPQTFTKDEKLCSFKEIDSLVKTGENIFRYPFKAVYLIKKPTENDVIRYNQLLISVPKRIFKKAVTRNLLKRKIRECYRKNKESFILPQGITIHLMLVYISKDILEYKYIESKIKDILDNISKAVAKSN